MTKASNTRKAKAASKKAAAKKANGSKDPSNPRVTVTAKTAAKDFGLTGPVVDDVTGQKGFSKEDLMQYELAQHKLANAAQASRIKKHEADDYQRTANQKLASLQSVKKQLDVVAKQRGEELTQLQEALMVKYDIDLSKITYDDETGRITEPPPDAAESQPAA